MGSKNLSSFSKPLAARMGVLRLFLSMEFSFILLLGSYIVQNWHFGIGSLVSTPFNALCNMCILYSLLLLGFRAWDLSRRHEALLRASQQCSKACHHGTGSEGEEGDVMKLKKELAEERRLRAAAVAELEEERLASSSATFLRNGRGAGDDHAASEREGDDRTGGSAVLQGGRTEAEV